MERREIMIDADELEGLRRYAIRHIELADHELPGIGKDIYIPVRNDILFELIMNYQPIKERETK